MIGDEGLHRFDLPRCSNAVGKVKGACHLASEAIDIEGDAADGGIGQRRLQLRRDPLVGGQTGGLPDPRPAMDQRASDLDDRDPVDDGEGLAAVSRLSGSQVITEERRPGGQGGCILFLGRSVQPFNTDFPPHDPGPKHGQESECLGGIDHQRGVEDALGDLGEMHHASSAGRGSRSSPSST